LTRDSFSKANILATIRSLKNAQKIPKVIFLFKI
jgi:hypothetical protein